MQRCCSLLVLISERFNRLALPYLYEHISAEHFPSDKFARTIMDNPSLAELVRGVSWTILWERVLKPDAWFYSPSRHEEGIKEAIWLAKRFVNVKHIALCGAIYENVNLLDAEDLQASRKFPWPTSQQLANLTLTHLTSLTFITHDNDFSGLDFSAECWQTLANLVNRCPSLKNLNLPYLASLHSYRKGLLSPTTLRRLFVRLKDSFDVTQLAVLLHDCKNLGHLTLDSTTRRGLDQLLPLAYVVRQSTSLEVKYLNIGQRTPAIHSIVPSIQVLRLHPYPDMHSNNPIRNCLSSLFPPQHRLEQLKDLRLSFPVECCHLFAHRQRSTLLHNLQPLLSRTALPRLELCRIDLQFSRMYDMEAFLETPINANSGIGDLVKAVTDAVIAQFRLLARGVPLGLMFEISFKEMGWLCYNTLKRLVTRDGGEVQIEMW